MIATSQWWSVGTVAVEIAGSFRHWLRNYYFGCRSCCFEAVAEGQMGSGWNMSTSRSWILLFLLTAQRCIIGFYESFDLSDSLVLALNIDLFWCSLIFIKTMNFNWHLNWQRVFMFGLGHILGILITRTRVPDFIDHEMLVLLVSERHKRNVIVLIVTFRTSHCRAVGFLED